MQMRLLVAVFLIPLSGCLGASDSVYDGPEVTGGTQWLQGGPLSIAELEGEVVLVDFWTYSCVNCIRTLPHLTAWYDTYAPYGFTIIGVHSPEFDFEKDPVNVADAIARHGINYPVVMDNDFTIWREWDQRFWPAKYLLDTTGKEVFHKFGEGDYELTETKIRGLLEAQGKNLPPPVEVGDGFDPNVPTTRELYAGTWRGPDHLGNSEGYQAGKDVDYELPAKRDADRFYLSGTWHNGKEAMRAVGPGEVWLKFSAAAANFVADGAGCVPVYIDDEPIAEEFRGVAVSGEPPCIKIDGARSYDFFAGAYGNYELRLEVPDGFELYTFAFSRTVV